MTSHLPPQVAAWVSATVRRKLQVHTVTPERMDMYVQSSPEFFNEIVLDHLALRHAQCGFYAAEHEDWVYPALCMQGGAASNPARVSPLNSWVLKSPVDLVPSRDQIVEEYEWRLELAKAFSGTPITLFSPDDLHEQYVKKACEQVIDHIKMLSLWVEAGRPREQQDCYTGMDRKHVKKVLALQRLSELDAKEKLGLFMKYYAPSFISDQLRASHAREQVICDQLRESMRYC